jgi:formate C-acetyltransferase
MESLTLYQINNAISKSTSVTAVAATKVAGVRVARSLHTTSMKNTTGLNTKTSKKSSIPSVQTKTYATQAPCITKDAAAKSEIDVEGWIKKHYTPYEGDASFLAGPTEKTKKLFAKAEEYLAKERANGGLYDVDPHTPSTITSHKPG